jgi:hypothetical protein
MSESIPALLRANLAFAWIWIIFGLISGALMGLRFKDEKWLGGYSSFPRRIYRLGHISFFALGLVNWVFALTAISLGFDSATTRVAAWAFMAGGILMPICCAIMANYSKARPALLFAAPVTSLLLAAGLTIQMILFP